MVFLTFIRYNRNDIKIFDYLYYCYTCRNGALHFGIIRKYAFSFFFVPLIPLWSRKMIVCHVCGRTANIKEFPIEGRITDPYVQSTQPPPTYPSY